MGSPLEVLANYNPTGFALANQQRQAQLAQTQAQTGAIASEVAGRQALTQEQLIKNQLAQRDLQDRDIMQRALANTDGSVEKVTDYALKNGISAPGYFGLQGQIISHKQALQNLDLTSLKLEGDRNDLIGGAFSGYQSKPQAERTADDWNAARQKAVSLSPDLDANLPAAGRVPTDSDLAVPIGLVNYHGKQVKETLERAQASEAISKGKESDVKAQREQMLLDAWKKAQQAPGSMRYQFIDEQIPPGKSAAHAALNQSARSAYDSMLGAGAPPENAVKAVEPFATRAAEIDKETNPAILGARRASEIQTRVGTQQALAATAGPAFSNIADAAARGRAETAYQKDSEEYADKVGAARQLRDFVAAAQSGNKAAPGLVPISEVRQLVNRVNRQELQSVSSSAGSAWDRIQGKIGSLTEGQPIPPDILHDIGVISGVMENAARRTYTNKVAVTNNTFGSKAQPVTLPETPATAPMAPTPAVQPAAKFQKGDTVMYQGKAHKVLEIKPNGRLVLEP